MRTTTTVRHACTLGMFAVGFATSALHGQVLGAADVSGVLGRSGGRPWHRASWVSPTIVAQYRDGFVQATGLVVEETGRLALPNLRVDAALSSSTFGVFRVTTFGQLLRDGMSTPLLRSETSLSSTVSARLGRGGLWLGAGRIQVAGIAPSDSVPRLALLAGAWRTLGRAMLSIAAQEQQQRFSRQQMTTRQVSYVDSVYTDSSGWEHYTVNRTVVDTALIRRLRRWTDLEARIDWSVGRVILGAAVSTRETLDSARMALGARINAALQLNSRIALVGSVGALPEPRRLQSSRFATLGIRVTPAALLRQPPPAPVRPSATAFRATQLSPGTWRISLRVPGARTVEVSGDFNHWSPIALRETAPDTWEATLALPAGTHRISVRVNGDSWSAPPGLPSIDDEFNGKVGLLVIR